VLDGESELMALVLGVTAGVSVGWDVSWPGETPPLHAIRADDRIKQAIAVERRGIAFTSLIT